jgi:hypothetical protein
MGQGARDIDGATAMGERRRARSGQHRKAGMSGIPAAAVSVAAAFIVLGAADDVRAQTIAADGGASAALSARAQAPPRARTRARIRVTPAYPYRLYSTDYPTPYKYEYPGPGAVRQCRAWLAQEFRPSGTVVVPKMNCWWVRG